MTYDIIGDIHGYADNLEILLQKMGYRRKAGVYSHPENRKMIFVGDFIDRGPKIRATLHLVKDMCDAGHAQAVMGNHEFNAICYHTPQPNHGFYRKHSEKNLKQHKETLMEFNEHDSEWADYLTWFGQLPLFLEFEDFRVVHACWDDKNIDWLKANYKGLTKDLLAKANDKSDKTAVYTVIDETLKGKECSLPLGISFQDKDGTIRTECRLKWWHNKNDANVFNDILLQCPSEIAEIKIPVPSAYYSYTENKPVFFGHYWLKGTPNIENENAVCLDFSVAKGGVLVACRLEKTDKGLNKNLIY